MITTGTSIYLVICNAVNTVRSDVNDKYLSELRGEEVKINRCRYSFYENLCDDGDRPQAAEFCAEKEECMNKIAQVEVSMLRVAAKYLANGINAFSDDLSFNAIIVFSILMLISLFFMYFIMIPVTAGTIRRVYDRMDERK